MTLPLFLYRLCVVLLGPLIGLYLRRRARLGKEDADRLNERFGHASAPKFQTAPIWIHAASVGESVAALNLIEIIRDRSPQQPILITTGTITSARVIENRLPGECHHQFAPHDHPIWIARFLNYWRPCAAIRMESEIWPVTLLTLQKRNIPVALINARLSAKSAARWGKCPKTIQTILLTFKIILADGDVVAERLRALGATAVSALPNIKFLAAPAACPPDAFHHLMAQLNNRPDWLYASTHADEEIIAAEAHIALKKEIPSVLTIIVPRHPTRMPSILNALAPFGLNIARRSQGDPITSDTDLYIADTMGELPLFYAATPLAVIGRSFSQDGGGGHNPIEAAMTGCYPLSGPHVQNMDTVFDTLIHHHAAEIIETPQALPERILFLLTHPPELETRRQTAQNVCQALRGSTKDQLRSALHSFLSQVHK